MAPLSCSWLVATGKWAGLKGTGFYPQVIRFRSVASGQITPRETLWGNRLLLSPSAHSEPAPAGALGWDGGLPISLSGDSHLQVQECAACPRKAAGLQGCSFGSRCREMAVRRPGINVS